jgi:hypothetical protein
MDSTIPPLGPATARPPTASGDAGFEQVLNSLVGSPMNALGGEGSLNGVVSIFMLGLLEKIIDPLPERISDQAITPPINPPDTEGATGDGTAQSG